MKFKTKIILLLTALFSAATWANTSLIKTDEAPIDVIITNNTWCTFTSYGTYNNTGLIVKKELKAARTGDNIISYEIKLPDTEMCVDFVTQDCGWNYHYCFNKINHSLTLN